MPRILARCLYTLSGLFLLYLWAGFLAVPALGLWIGNQWLSQHVDGPARLQRMEFNPLSLELKVWQFSAGEQPQLALEAAQTRLNWRQLLSGRVQLDYLHLQQPSVLVELDEQGQPLLARLFLLPERPPATEDKPPFPFSLIEGRIDNARLHVLDPGPSPAINNQFTGLNLQLTGLHLDQDSPLTFSLQGQGDDGTRLAADGQFSLTQRTGSLQLKLDSLPLASWWAYVSRQLPLHQQHGVLQLDGHAELALQPALDLQVDPLNLQLSGLQLSDAQSNLLLDSKQLRIENAAMSLSEQQLSIDSLLLQELNLPLSVDRQGRLNWQALAPAKPGASTDTPNSDGFRLDQLPWHIKLGQARLENSTLDLALHNQPAPVELRLRQLELSLNNFDSRSNQPVKASLSTLTGEQGQIRINADIQPQTFATRADIDLKTLDLRPAQTWISPYARVELRSAQLSSQLKANLNSLQPLAFDLGGDLQLGQLHLTDSDPQKRDLLKWNSLKLQQLSYRHGDHMQLDIGQVQVRQPYARLVINENLQSNFATLLIPQPASPQSTGKATPFTFRLGEILIEQGSAHFADFSLQPHFATAIHKLDGRIGTLASNSQAPTPVQLTGSVDNYAPVSIKGQLTPFDPLQQLDITTEFNHVELTALTPYSGKFAGYRIHKGRLNLALHYQINQGKLNASNSVLLEQLQLGEKVDSDEALNLPIKLAVAMLKDTRGNISINLPVSGDLNSPEFKVMPIVWQTLRNLLSRAVTSPFRMLAGIGQAGDTDLGQVPFAAGSAELDSQARTSLDNLAAALRERPMLRLNIEGTSAARLDGPAVARHMLERRLQELHYQQLQARGKTLPDDPYSQPVEDKQRDHLLDQLYQSMAQQNQLPAMPSGLPRKERPQWQQQQILQQLAENPLFLRELAQRRAAAIRSHLVEQGQVEVERLFLLDVNEQASPDGDTLYSQLHLDVL